MRGGREGDLPLAAARRLGGGWRCRRSILLVRRHPHAARCCPAAAGGSLTTKESEGLLMAQPCLYRRRAGGTTQPPPGAWPPRASPETQAGPGARRGPLWSPTLPPQLSCCICAVSTSVMPGFVPARATLPAPRESALVRVLILCCPAPWTMCDCMRGVNQKGKQRTDNEGGWGGEGGRPALTMSRLEGGLRPAAAGQGSARGAPSRGLGRSRAEQGRVGGWPAPHGGGGQPGIRVLATRAAVLRCTARWVPLSTRRSRRPW